MKRLILCIFFLTLGTLTMAQNEAYPIIQGYGSIIEMPFEVINPDPNLDYKLLAEAYQGQEDKSELYGMLDYFARVINAHAYAGVPDEKFNMAVVLFSGSAYTILNNEEYNKRFGMDNPNLELFQRLQEAGVDVFVCGQSMMKQDMLPENIAEGIKIGSSRITISSELRTRGYVSIF